MSKSFWYSVLAVFGVAILLVAQAASAQGLFNATDLFGSRNNLTAPAQTATNNSGGDLSITIEEVSTTAGGSNIAVGDLTGLGGTNYLGGVPSGDLPNDQVFTLTVTSPGGFLGNLSYAVSGGTILTASPGVDILSPNEFAISSVSDPDEYFIDIFSEDPSLLSISGRYERDGIGLTDVGGVPDRILLAGQQPVDLSNFNLNSYLGGAGGAGGAGGGVDCVSLLTPGGPGARLASLYSSGDLSPVALTQGNNPAGVQELQDKCGWDIGAALQQPSSGGEAAVGAGAFGGGGESIGAPVGEGIGGASSAGTAPAIVPGFHAATGPNNPAYYQDASGVKHAALGLPNGQYVVPGQGVFNANGIAVPLSGGSGGAGGGGMFGYIGGSPFGGSSGAGGSSAGYQNTSSGAGWTPGAQGSGSAGMYGAGDPRFNNGNPVINPNTGSLFSSVPGGGLFGH